MSGRTVTPSSTQMPGYFTFKSNNYWLKNYSWTNLNHSSLSLSLSQQDTKKEVYTIRILRKEPSSHRLPFESVLSRSSTMDKLTVGMTVRRHGAKLHAMSKAHSPLHMVLWQARQSQSALLAAAAAQKTLFNDMAAWASTENRALSDVCSCASELSSLYSSALVQIALAYKSLRKDMLLILEGEKRSDLAQKKLQEADEKRLKLRRQVLRAQNKRLVNGENPNPRISGDFTALQTQLSEAERTADRLHVEACDASREQEAVKLVVVRAALGKLSDAHLTLSNQARVIFEGEREITLELPDPPPPGDPLSSMRYAGHEVTRAVVERVKSQVHLPTSPLQPYTSTPVVSPSSRGQPPPRQSWTPTAPNPSHRGSEDIEVDPPPPYNVSFLSGSGNGREEDDPEHGMNEDGGGRRRRPRPSSGGSSGSNNNGGGRRRSFLNNSTVSPSPVPVPVTTAHPHPPVPPTIAATHHQYQNQNQNPPPPHRYQNQNGANNHSRNNSGYSVRSNGISNPPHNPFYEDDDDDPDLQHPTRSPPPRY